MIDYLLKLEPEALFALILALSVCAICTCAVLRSMGKYGLVGLFLLVAAAAILDRMAGGAISSLLKGAQ